MSEAYAAFLARRAQLDGASGFAPTWLPDALFDFQRVLTEWAVRHGRAALFEDCGMGKTPQQLVWAENVVRRTNGRVLILTPLAVGAQTVREGEKFGVECRRSLDGSLPAKIVVANYQRLHYFKPDDFVGVVCDESSCLKSFEAVTRAAVTEFMRRVPFRLLCTATAAPNDYIELGTSSEALGHLGFMDMLGRFFKNEQQTSKPVRRWTAQKHGWASLSAGGGRGTWRFKGHAETPFWRWVCSWARALRRPSDLGFDDGRFVLPPLGEREHLVATRGLSDGMLFALPAQGLNEQRQEARRTVKERCERVAELVSGTGRPALVWCNLNVEGDLLEHLIPDAVQVAGSDSDDAKEARLMAFAEGRVRVLVTKPRIGAWGLNLQHCAHITWFPSHSFEAYYQAVRRCWRFGQMQPVVVDIVLTEGERAVMVNLQRKALAADRMFSQLVAEMAHAAGSRRDIDFTLTEEVPTWLSPTR